MMSTTNANDSAGVSFPPPLLYVAGLLLGIFGGRLLPGALPRTTAFTIAGFVLLFAGLALVLWAPVLFRMSGTNIAPNQPANVLVVVGPYRVTRNPMYVGLACIYAAVALWTSSLWALVLLLPVLLVVRYAIIAKEERYLAAKFGDAYREYTARVRRWV